MRSLSFSAKRSARLISRKVSRHKVTLGLMLLAGVMLYFFLEPPAIADLSEEHRHYTGELLQSWEEGKIIVLLRHLERCDRHDVPCLTDKEGITARAKTIGEELRDDFHELGLERAVIYNSPRPRTAETEALVFNDIGEDRDWLINCETDFLGDTLRNKQVGRNLVLVTHSRCIKRFQEALGYAEEIPAYGTALFFSIAGPSDPLKALGFLDAEDWYSTLGF